MHTGELKSSHRALRTYSNHKLKPVAAVDLPLKYKGRKMKAEFEIENIEQENALFPNRTHLDTLKHAIPDPYMNIRKYAFGVLSIFGSTYVWAGLLQHELG